MISIGFFETKWGWGAVVIGSRGVMGVVLPEHEKDAIQAEMAKKYAQAEVSDGSSSQIAQLLQRYFKGERVDFSLALDYSRCTPFQRATYEATRSIPYGEVRSYQWLSHAIEKPFTARAVGQALSVNPFPVIVPCHRVVRKDGSLGGFSARGGIGLKRELLRLEGQIL